MKRRAFLQSTLAGMSALSVSTKLLAAKQKAGGKIHNFPEGFLWGPSTAAHQVEGNNTNSDYWLLEHLANSPFVEPSMDTCDHYHQYPQDIKLIADLGFNCYRFSVEWARIEPEKGYFSKASLDHYRHMAQVCHEYGIKPLVTFCLAQSAH